MSIQSKILNFMLKKYVKDVENFFNFYQDNFSWSQGGKEETEFFENMYMYVHTCT